MICFRTCGQPEWTTELGHLICAMGPARPPRRHPAHRHRGARHAALAYPLRPRLRDHALRHPEPARGAGRDLLVEPDPASPGSRAGVSRAARRTGPRDAFSARTRAATAAGGDARVARGEDDAPPNAISSGRTAPSHCDCRHAGHPLVQKRSAPRGQYGARRGLREGERARARVRSRRRSPCAASRRASAAAVPEGVPRRPCAGAREEGLAPRHPERRPASTPPRAGPRAPRIARHLEPGLRPVREAPRRCRPPGPRA